MCSIAAGIIAVFFGTHVFVVDCFYRCVNYLGCLQIESHSFRCPWIEYWSVHFWLSSVCCVQFEVEKWLQKELVRDD